MTEYGSHITVSYQPKPSIFDVLAQQNLGSTLSPAIHHILEIIASYSPSKLNWCSQYKSEIYLILHFLLQRHYLNNYGSSFSENFYNLKRIKAGKRKIAWTSLTLPNKFFILSLLDLVFLPYVVQCLRRKYESFTEDETPQQAKKTAIKRLLIRSWSLLLSLYEGSKLMFFIRYIIGRSDVPCPSLALCGLTLDYLNHDDLALIEGYQQQLPFKSIRNASDLLKWVLFQCSNNIADFLEVGAFFLQFLEWFYGSGENFSAINSGTIPEPPHEGIVNISSSDCPICLKKRRQDTALAVSGYVFCYVCIFQYVTRHEACPLTGYPASKNDLVKIYSEAEDL